MQPHIRKRPRPTPAASASDSSATAPIGHNRTAALRLKIEYVETTSLQRPLREIRKHSAKQIDQLAASIRRFGNMDPIVVDTDDRIVTGLGRFLAALKLQLPHVPVLRADHLDADELRAYAIAENKLGEKGEWDFSTLAVEVKELNEIDGLELEVTGLDTLEIEKLLLDEAGAAATVAESEEIEEPAEGEPVSRIGDIFKIGNHKLACGSSRDPETFSRLMGNDRARMVVADLPYNVRIERNVSGLGRKKHGEFVEGSGEMTPAEFTSFMSDIFSNLVAYSVNGSIHFQCMDWRHQAEMMAAGSKNYTELKNMLVWAKTNAGMGTFYRSQYELIYAWKSGRQPHVNNFGLGETGRWRSNLLTYPGCNVFRKGRDEDLEAHSTVKPTQLVADLIRDVSHVGDIVLDPCAGSGTTILAAERVKRRARCIELDPKYVDVAIRRARTRLGLDAIHVETGLTFDELAEVRRYEMAEGEPAGDDETEGEDA